MSNLFQLLVSSHRHYYQPIEYDDILFITHLNRKRSFVIKCWHQLANNKFLHNWSVYWYRISMLITIHQYYYISTLLLYLLLNYWSTFIIFNYRSITFFLLIILLLILSLSFFFSLFSYILTLFRTYIVVIISHHILHSAFWNRAYYPRRYNSIQ